MALIEAVYEFDEMLRNRLLAESERRVKVPETAAELGLNG
jgi:hypothetical protein